MNTSYSTESSAAAQQHVKERNARVLLRIHWFNEGATSDDGGKKKSFMVFKRRQPGNWENASAHLNGVSGSYFVGQRGGQKRTNAAAAAAARR